MKDDGATAPIQRRPTRWSDIQENGVGVIWGPHKTKADGASTALGSASGTGATVDSRPEPKVVYGSAGWEATGVTAENLGRQLAPNTGALAHPAQYFTNYSDAPLLPLQVGGDNSVKNVVALPPDKPNALQILHQAILGLTEDGFVNVKVAVREAQDPVATPQGHHLYYAQEITSRWSQAAPDGTDVPGSIGHYTARLAPPSESAKGALATSKSTLVADHLIDGKDNQARKAKALPLPGARRATLKTRIQFAGTTGDGDGTHMVASMLGPDHGIGEQPGSGGLWSARTGQLHAKSNKKMKYVAGHLLNHHLGGPGNDARNLAPIPADVNDLHESRVESAVKDLVRAGHWVYYEVKVSYGADGSTNYPNSFLCTWAQLDAAGEPIPSTWKRVDLPIRSPTTYAGATPSSGKKLPNLASHAVHHEGTDAGKRVGVTTTLGFDEVLLEDPATLGAQYTIMKPLVEALNTLGLNRLFATNDALKNDVFHAMSMAKPSAEETEAREGIELQTKALREATTLADADAAREAIEALHGVLGKFVHAIKLRADASNEAASMVLERHYDTGSAVEFARLIKEQSERAMRDLELTVESTRAVKEFAEKLLTQHQRVSDQLRVPQTPSQSLYQNDEEEERNSETHAPANDSIEAQTRTLKRRLLEPAPTLAQPPPSAQVATRLLDAIGGIDWTTRAFPPTDTSLSQEAQTIGQSIAVMVAGLPGTQAALKLVVESLYKTQTRAFNEYAKWLLG